LLLQPPDFPATFHCLRSRLRLRPPLQVCHTDDEVAAALEAWARYGPLHSDPAAEYERLRPPPPKAPKLNTLDRFFKKPAQQQLPQKQQEQVQAQQQKQEQGHGQGQQQGQWPPHEDKKEQGQGQPHPQRQQEAQQSQQPQQGGPGSSMGAGSSAGAGAASGNALQALMAAARHPPKQSLAAAPGPKGPSASAAAVGGGISGVPRHSFPQATWARGLVDIAANPERYVCVRVKVSKWAGMGWQLVRPPLFAPLLLLTVVSVNCCSACCLLLAAGTASTSLPCGMTTAAAGLPTSFQRRAPPLVVLLHLPVWPA
jgi:hypothetical protein